MNNNDLLQVPAYFHREYENDFPKQEATAGYVSQALRVAKVGLPFVALYQPLGKVLAYGLGVTRTVSSLNECFAAEDYEQLSWAMFNTCLAVGSVAATIFLHPLGMLITTLSDIGMNAHHVYGAISRGDMLEAGKQTMRVANNSFYLGMIVIGSVELQLTSLAIQVILEGSLCYEEFNKDNWLEALGHLGMAAVRTNQSYRQLEILQQKWEVEHLSHKTLALKPVIKEAVQPKKSSEQKKIETHESTPFEKVGLESKKWHPLLTSLEEQHGNCLSLACEDEDSFPQLKSYGNKGNAVAVWVDEQENHHSTENFFSASHYDASKRTWSKPSTFSSNPFTLSFGPVVGDTGSNWSILGVDSIGNATVVWANGEIQVASFKSSTNQWTDALSLGEAHDPVVSFDSDRLGNYTLAWSNYGASAENLFSVVNYDAETQEWSSPISFNSSAYRPEEGDFRRIAPLTVKRDDDGYVSVMCCDRLERNLFGVVYDSIQKEWSSPEVISSGFKHIRDLQIASIGSGQFMGIWIEEKDKCPGLLTNTLNSSTYDSSGKKWNTPIQVFESDQLLEIESLQLQQDALGNVVAIWEQDVNRRSGELLLLYEWFKSKIDEFKEDWVEDFGEEEAKRLLQSGPVELFLSSLVSSSDIEMESVDQVRRLLTEDRPLKIGAATFDTKSNSWNLSDLVATLPAYPVLVNACGKLHVFWNEYGEKSSSSSDRCSENEYCVKEVSGTYYDALTKTWSSPKTIFDFPSNAEPEICSIGANEDKLTIGWFEEDDSYRSCSISLVEEDI